MNLTEKSQRKNAPLTLPADRDVFVNWSLEQPDGGISAGFQPLHPRLADETPVEVLRASAAKLVSLLRRERHQSPEQLASAAAVKVADVLALELGESVGVETAAKVASALQVSKDVLVQLMGFSRTVDQSLVRAALEFVSRLEPVEPLDARETDALRGFRNALAIGSPRAEAS